MLIDTHILIWALNGERGTMGAQTLKVLELQPVVVSVASLTEIAIKARKGKLVTPDTDQILSVLLLKHTEVLDIKAKHASEIPGLEISAHADPFDLLLIAQSISEGLPFLTCDKKILEIACPGLRLIDGRK